MTEGKVELRQTHPALEKEWVVAPVTQKELPGLRRFIEISGYGSPENFQVSAAAFSFKSILDGLLGKGTIDDVKRLFGLLKSNQAGDVDRVLSQIKLTDLLPNRAPEGKTLLDAVKLLEQSDKTAPGAEVLRVITEEINARAEQRVDANTLDQITVDFPINEGRIARLAQALGIPESELQNRSLNSFLDYLSALSKRVDELQDFAAAETSFLVTRERIPEVRMLDDVVLQTGLDCVPYALLNLVRAANNQGAMVESVSLDEIKRWTPRDEGSAFRHMASGRVISDFLPNKRFTAHSDFSWGEAIKFIRERRGGLFLRLDYSHAVAVVGIRHSNTDPPHIEFLVANSLVGSGERGRPYWAKANELVSRTQLLNMGIGQTERQDNFLITWNLPERAQNMADVASQIFIGEGRPPAEESRHVLERVAQAKKKKPETKKSSKSKKRGRGPKKPPVFKITKKDL